MINNHDSAEFLFQSRSKSPFLISWDLLVFFKYFLNSSTGTIFGRVQGLQFVHFVSNLKMLVSTINSLHWSLSSSSELVSIMPLSSVQLVTKSSSSSSLNPSVVSSVKAFMEASFSYTLFSMTTAPDLLLIGTLTFFLFLSVHITSFDFSLQPNSFVKRPIYILILVINKMKCFFKYNYK